MAGKATSPRRLCRDRRRRRPGVPGGWLAAIAVAALCWVWPPAAGGSESRLEFVGGGPEWVVAGLRPGKPVLLPGVAHLTVFSSQPWSLEIDASLAADAVDRVALRSTIVPLLSEPEPREGGRNRGTVAAGGAQSEAAAALVDQPPTGAEGRTLTLDLLLEPSWDDPPDATYTVRLAGRLSGGAQLAASYVSPPQWEAGYAEPVVFWFFAPAEGAGGERTVTLRVTAVGERDASFTAAGVLQGAGWQSVTASLGDLPVGEYRYVIEDGDGARLAAGAFAVLAPGSQPPAPEGAAPSLQVQAASAAAEEPAPFTWLEARLQVDRAEAPPGEPAPWRVRIFNPGKYALLDASLLICHPPQWHVVAAQEPSRQAQSGDRACRELLLGALPGGSERKVEFSLMRWPPPELGAFAPVTAEELHLYLFVRPSGAGEKVLLRSVRAALGTKERAFPVERAVSGRAFFDRDGDGLWQEGDAPAAGVDIVVDGKVVRQTTRTGAFTVHLSRGTHVIWARAGTHSGRPVVVRVGEADVEGLLLPIGPPGGADRGEPGNDAAGRSLTQLFVAAAARAGAAGGGGDAATEPGEGRAFDRVESDYRLQAHHAGPWGAVDWELVHPRSSPAQSAPFGPSQSGTLRIGGGAHRWEGAWRFGVPERVRFGALRPSMPVDSAWALALRVPPHLVPGPVPAALGLDLETGAAQGDFWRCHIGRAGMSWSRGDFRLRADTLRSNHERYDERGPRADAASLLSVEGAGLIPLGERSWAYQVGFYGGDRRELSPSCGFSPRDGKHLTLSLSPPWQPLNAVAAPGRVEELSLAASRWPSGGRAYEVAVRSGPLRLGKAETSGPTVQLTPLLQWGRTSGGDEVWARPALAAELRAGAHRLSAGWGPAALSDVENEAQVNRGASRRALGWRWEGARLALMSSLELYEDKGLLRRVGSVGFSLKELQLAGWPGWRGRISGERSLGVTRIRDELRLEAKAAGYEVRLRVSGRQPLAGNAPGIFAMPTYEESAATLTWKGGGAGRARAPAESVRWSFELAAERANGTAARRLSVGLDGTWRTGAGAHGSWGGTVGREASTELGAFYEQLALSAYVTCVCAGAQWEAEGARVWRWAAPESAGPAAPSLTYLRVKASRPLQGNLAAFAEGYTATARTERLAGLAIPAFAIDVAEREAALTVGLEWAPLGEGLPAALAAGLRFDLTSGARGTRPQWLVAVKAPLSF